MFKNAHEKHAQHTPFTLLHYSIFVEESVAKTVVNAYANLYRNIV